MYRKIENLKEVLENHLIYLETGDLSKHANLSGVNLSGMDLSDVDLSYADLSGANLRGTDLYAAKLNGALLNNADLSRSYICDTDLSGAEGLNGK